MLEALRRVPSPSVGEILRVFYRLYARCFDKPRWGDKTPVYVLQIEALKAALPEARFVHIIRDCRAVVASIRQLWFSLSDDPSVIAARWVHYVQEGRRQGAKIPHYRELRFEELVRRPEEVLRALCPFLDLQFEPGMLAYQRRAARRLESLQSVVHPSGRIVATASERQAALRRVG